jgi:hypothetical protein
MVRLLCTGFALGVAVLLLSQSHFYSAPQAAEIASPSAHTGELPQLW